MSTDQEPSVIEAAKVAAVRLARRLGVVMSIRDLQIPVGFSERVAYQVPGAQQLHAVIIERRNRGEFEGRGFYVYPPLGTVPEVVRDDVGCWVLVFTEVP